METPHLIRRDFLKTATSLTPVLFGTGAALFASCAPQQKQLEKNKAVVIRLTEDFWNAKDINTIDRFYSQKLVTHSPNAPQDGNFDSFKKQSIEDFKAL